MIAQPLADFGHGRWKAASRRKARRGRPRTPGRQRRLNRRAAVGRAQSTAMKVSAQPMPAANAHSPFHFRAQPDIDHRHAWPAASHLRRRRPRHPWRRARLGGARAALYWVDVKGRKIFRRDADGNVAAGTRRCVGSLAPRAGGGFVAGTGRVSRWSISMPAALTCLVILMQIGQPLQ